MLRDKKERQMKTFVSMNAVFAFLFGSLAFADDASKAAAEPAQGVSGKVIKMTGNFMPGPGPRPGGTQAPLSVPVHVFKGKVAPFLKPDPKHPQLVKIVNSDRDGTYRVALEPGEYTLVAEIEAKLYLNSFTDSAGKMVWSTITVAAGKWATWDIKDSSGAAF
jgi:hypothetical protein